MPVRYTWYVIYTWYQVLLATPHATINAAACKVNNKADDLGGSSAPVFATAIACQEGVRFVVFLVFPVANVTEEEGGLSHDETWARGIHTMGKVLSLIHI